VTSIQEVADLGLTALVEAHPRLQSVLTGDEGPTESMDEAIATYTSLWMTAMLFNLVLSEGEHAASRMFGRRRLRTP